MGGLKIIPEINPKLSLLNSDILLTIQIINELDKNKIRNFEFEAKVFSSVIFSLY